MKRLNFVLAAAVAMSAVALSAVMLGCGKGRPAASNRLVVWHWMTDREEAFRELSRRYKEATGVDVVFQLYAPSDNYTNKVRVGAQTNTLPDIFGVLGDARDLARFINAGHLENFQSALDANQGAWRNRFFREALQTASFSAGNPLNVPAGDYGIPLDVTTIPMILNVDLFTAAGLDPANPPATWPEFIAAGKKLKATGVSGFVSGWGEPWLIYSLVTDLAHNLMGPAKVMATFKGEVPYTDPQWVRVFQAFKELQEAGFADPSLVTMPNKNAEKSFATGRGGITFNGSWAVNVYAGMTDKLKYLPFRPPALNPKNPRPVWGGAGSVFSVNARSGNKQAAVDFLKWLSDEPQAAYLVQATRNLPAVKLTADVEPLLKAFASMMEGSIHPNRFEVIEDPQVQEVMNKGIQSLLIGEKTPESLAADVQKMKDRVKQEQQ